MKDKKWLAAVGSIDCCVRCGRYGVQVAHRNQGKGMGMKVSDCLTAALCPQCHHEIDNGTSMDRDERRRVMDECIIKTIEILHSEGKIFSGKC